LIPTFLKALQAFGPYHNHSALLVQTAEMHSSRIGQDFASELSKVFKHVDVKSTGNNLEGGWPLGPNKHFWFANMFLEEIGNAEPWLLMELDSLPLQTGWIKLLEDEYTLYKRPYLGNITEFYKVDMVGNRKNYSVAGRYLSGVAVYPPSHYRYCDVIKFPNAKTPFDILTRAYTTQRGEELFAQQSNRMEHRWRTCNYRRENGQIVCDSVGVEDSVKDFSGVVDLTGKVFIHGCKDDSLANLILEGVQIPNSNTLATKKEQESEKTAQENLPQQKVVRVVHHVMDGRDMEEIIPGVYIQKGADKLTLLDRLQFFLSRGEHKISPETGIADPEPGANVVQPSDSPATSGASEGVKVASEVIHTQPAPVSGGAQNFPSPEELESILSSSEKKLRLGEVMDKFGIEKSKKGEFQAHLIQIGYKASAPAYWVSKAA
jgi:hypothetical protein